jgi:uncharacterized protein (TIGR03437 family)
MVRSVVISGLIAVGCGSAQTAAPTFSKDIAPIFYASCTTCHRPGQVASFSLITYDDAVKHGRTIVETVQSRYMPPWKPDPGWVDYRDSRLLTDAQIELFTQWFNAGMPQGDPAATPPVPTFPDGWQLGTPDLVLEMAVPYSVPAEGADIYRNFVLPTSITQDKWVRAIELKPSARPVVHHVLFYSDNTGTARSLDGKDGQPGFPGLGTVFTATGNPLSALTGGLGGWVPGTTPQYLPDGVTMPLPANSDLLLQMHFHLNGAPQQEKTQVGIYFGDKPARDLTQLQVPAFFGIQANIDIPANEANYKVRGSFTLPVDVDAVSVSAHSHYLGKSAKLTATLPSGEVKILLWIKSWDFSWQDQYIFKNFIALPKGTRLDGEYTYDNSDANLKNPNYPAKEVRWGENSTDEMGSLILNVLPRDENDLGQLRLSTISYALVRAPQVGNKPLFVSSGIVDGASTEPGYVTPGKIIVLYGSRIGPSTLQTAQVGSDGTVATTLGGTQVTFDGKPAPLLYASNGQVAAVVPYEVDGKLGTQVQVTASGGTSDSVALPVTPVAPSVFSVDYTGSGQGAVLNQDGSVNSFKNPAKAGSIVSIFATGEGQTLPGGVDGKVATAASLPIPAKPVTVFINGKQTDVLYAGAAPGQVAGMLQVNVRVPADTPFGDIPVEVHVGDAKSQPGVTIAVQ